MSSIHDLVKEQETYRADVKQTVLELAQAMVDRNIGAVPVLREGELVGVFSERDLMKRVVVAGLDPGATRVEDVMTADPLTVSPRESIETCMVLMRRHGFRHLPICDGKVLKGIVSLRDIMLHDLNEKDHEVRMMRAYIQAAPPEM
jgi:CBS domain-containing protein